MRYPKFVAALGLPLISLGCSDDETPPAGSAGTGGSGNAPLALTSTAFADGATIPQQHACTTGGGENVSPPLSWTGGPSDAKSYAVVMRDNDFQNGFLHWVIYDIPKASTGLPEGVEAVFQPAAPAGAKQSRFLTGTSGYYGPCSPSSVNTYEFTVHALSVDTLPGLSDQSMNQDAATAVEAASLANAKLAGES